jgi:hypothetical protein
MEEQKLTQEEFSLINSIKIEYSHKVEEFGRLKMDKIFVKQQWDSLNLEEEKLEKEVSEIQSREKNIMKTLEEKYGIGTINMETGVFTKNV